MDPAMDNDPCTVCRDIGAVLLLESWGTDIWRSVTADANFGGEVFGGQYLGLSIAAAMRSAPGRTPHAMSAYFLSGARADKPVEYHVERTRDGRSFAHRRVTAMQDGKETFRAEVSFHEWEQDQAAHGTGAPNFPDKATLSSLHQLVREYADELGSAVTGRILNREHFSMHFRPGEDGLLTRGTRPEMAAWISPNPPPPSEPEAYYGTLAYMSDSLANLASRTMHSDSLYAGQIASSSLNHGMWFHSLPSAFEAVLYLMESPFAGGGLGYNRGAMFGAQGRILASVTQEALIRRRAGD
jgi:acyl-CoA thioesterase-2